MLIQDYFYSPAPSNVTPERGATLSGQSSYRQSKISMQDSIPNDFQEHLKQSTVWFSRSHLGEMCPFSVTSAFGPHLKLKPSAREGWGCAKPLASYLPTAWCFPDLILRKLSEAAPAETAGPTYRSFQGREAPLGQTGSDLSA